MTPADEGPMVEDPAPSESSKPSEAASSVHPPTEPVADTSTGTEETSLFLFGEDRTPDKGRATKPPPPLESSSEPKMPEDQSSTIQPDVVEDQPPQVEQETEHGVQIAPCNELKTTSGVQMTPEQTPAPSRPPGSRPPMRPSPTVEYCRGLFYRFPDRLTCADYADPEEQAEVEANRPAWTWARFLCPQVPYETYNNSLYVEDSYGVYFAADRVLLPADLGPIYTCNWPPHDPVPFQIKEQQFWESGRNALGIWDHRKDFCDMPYVARWSRLDKYFKRPENRRPYTIDATVMTYMGRIPSSSRSKAHIVQREAADMLRQYRKPPHYMYGKLEDPNPTYLRPNLHLGLGCRNLPTEEAITQLLLDLRRKKVQIIGFLDITEGVRPVVNNPDLIDRPWQFVEMPLEISVATAIRDWRQHCQPIASRWNPTGGVDASPCKWKHLPDYLLNKLGGLWHPELDVLHVNVAPNSRQWTQDAHEQLMDSSSQYRSEFLQHYEEEEHAFSFYHDIPFFTVYYRAVDNAWDTITATKPFVQPIKPAEEKDFFANPADALDKVRFFLRELVHASCMPPDQTAVAVPNHKTAAYLRNVLGWRGHIVDLTALNYPGMDRFPAWYLALWRECGIGHHLPCYKPTVRRTGLWSPTYVQRPDGTCGYYKCTLRHVQLLRHWTELFYSVIVLQEPYVMHIPRQYMWNEHDRDHLRHYMQLRQAELESIFGPGQIEGVDPETLSDKADWGRKNLTPVHHLNCQCAYCAHDDEDDFCRCLHCCWLQDEKDCPCYNCELHSHMGCYICERECGHDSTCDCEECRPDEPDSQDVSDTEY